MTVELEWFRLGCYVVGVIVSLVVTAELWRLPRHRITTAFIVVMVAWAANAGMLVGLFISINVAADYFPLWRPWVVTVNAVLQAVAPIAVLFSMVWSRRNYIKGCQDDA